MKKYYGPFLACLFGLAVLASACADNNETSTEANDEETVESEDTENTEDTEEPEEPEDTEGMDGIDGMEHGHGDGLEVPAGMTVPQISISSEADSVSGHNLFIELEDFTVTAESASTEPVDGEGHLHLYIDGERTIRFYNQALHIDGLTEGDHEVMVEINANNHSAYSVDGEPIQAMTTITVERTESSNHHNELFEPETAPVVAVTVTEDPKSGWNVLAETSDFRFSPESVGGEATAGQGHLHLLIDGEKVARLYGPNWHIPDLDPGTREITVEVVADDHSPYGLNGQAISATATVEVSAASDAVDEGADLDEDTNKSADEGHHGGSGATLDLEPGEADVNVEVSIADNSIEVEDRRVKVEQGSTVSVMVTSDMEESIHIHGYDLLVPVGPDGPAHVSFLADSPGVFEVELEDSQRFVFEIEVN